MCVFYIVVSQVTTLRKSSSKNKPNRSLPQTVQTLSKNFVLLLEIIRLGKRSTTLAHTHGILHHNLGMDQLTTKLLNGTRRRLTFRCHLFSYVLNNIFEFSSELVLGNYKNKLFTKAGHEWCCSRSSS